MATFVQHVVICQILFIVFCSVCNGSKYSKDVNMKNDKFKDAKLTKEELFKKKLPQMYEERPFRIQKVQLVWEKAKKRLPESEWPDLFTELKIQDKLELETKKSRVDGKDKVGDLEAATREQMLRIMKKYQLYDDNKIDENETYKPDQEDMEKRKYKKQNKWDIDFEKKLDKLWKKAEMSGFTETELSELRKEFVHHQQKIEEFNQLKNQIHALDDNTVSGYRKPDPEYADKKDAKRSFKKQHQELLEKFRFLEEVVVDKGGLEFEEPRVVELWMLAKQANFSDVELASFKKELEHFEMRLKKLDYYQEQAKMIKSDKPSEKLGKTNEVTSDNQKEDHILKKAQENERKVKKLHYELKSKVASALGVSHAEL